MERASVSCGRQNRRANGQFAHCMDNQGMDLGRAAQDGPRTLVIGVGNAYRGDDAVGLVVAQALRAVDLPDTVIRQESGEATALMEAWAEAETVILVDAVCSGARPGTIHRLEAHAQAIPARFFHTSTHAFGVAEAIELARALGRLPRRLIVYGVEGQDFAAGAGLSPAVERVLPTVVERVVQEIRQQSCADTAEL